jgi:hypothetical protein
MSVANKGIPTLGTLLAFLGKLYFLVRTLANFSQLSVAKLIRQLGGPRCPKHHCLAQNLSLTPGSSFRSKRTFF